MSAADNAAQAAAVSNTNDSAEHEQYLCWHTIELQMNANRDLTKQEAATEAKRVRNIMKKRRQRRRKKGLLVELPPQYAELHERAIFAEGALPILEQKVQILTTVNLLLLEHQQGQPSGTELPVDWQDSLMHPMPTTTTTAAQAVKKAVDRAVEKAAAPWNIDPSLGTIDGQMDAHRHWTRKQAQTAAKRFQTKRCHRTTKATIDCLKHLVADMERRAGIAEGTKAALEEKVQSLTNQNKELYEGLLRQQQQQSGNTTSTELPEDLQALLMQPMPVTTTTLRAMGNRNSCSIGAPTTSNEIDLPTQNNHDNDTLPNHQPHADGKQHDFTDTEQNLTNNDHEDGSIAGSRALRSSARLKRKRLGATAVASVPPALQQQQSHLMAPSSPARPRRRSSAVALAKATPPHRRRSAIPPASATIRSPPKPAAIVVATRNAEPPPRQKRNPQTTNMMKSCLWIPKSPRR